MTVGYTMGFFFVRNDDLSHATLRIEYRHAHLHTILGSRIHRERGIDPGDIFCHNIDRDEWTGRLFPKVKELPQNPVMLLYGAELAQLILKKDVLTMERGIGGDRLTLEAAVGV